MNISERHFDLREVKSCVRGMINSYRVKVPNALSSRKR